MQIAEQILGDGGRLSSLIEANRHKEIVVVEGVWTFRDLRIGEHLWIPEVCIRPGVLGQVPSVPLTGMSNYASAQQQFQSSYANATGQLSSLSTTYQQQGQSIIDMGSQVVNDPTGPAAQQLATQFGVTLLNATSSIGGQFGTIARIAVGTVEGIASGLAVGGPIGAVAGGAIAFLESAISAATGSSSCTPPNCIVSQPGYQTLGIDGLDLISKNLYDWRVTIGAETDGNPLGYALYLAWTQVDPAYGRIGVNGQTTRVGAINFMTATAQGLTQVQPQYMGAATTSLPNFTDVSLQYDESQRPPTGNATQTSRGPVGTLIFNQISDKSGGDVAAQNAVTRLPSNDFLEYAVSGTVRTYYLYGLMTVIAHLTVGASDQAIASELKAQLHTLMSAGYLTSGAWDPSLPQTGPDPKFLSLIAWFDTKANLGSSPGAVAAATASSSTASKVAGGAAVVGGLATLGVAAVAVINGVGFATTAKSIYNAIRKRL